MPAEATPSRRGSDPERAAPGEDPRLFPRYPSKRAVTLPALHIVQEHLRCVPFQAMAEIAELLEITPAEVHDTMSFYGFFPQAPDRRRPGLDLPVDLVHAARRRRAARARLPAARHRAGPDDRRRQADRRVRRVPGHLRLRPRRPGRRRPGLRAARRKPRWTRCSRS